MVKWNIFIIFYLINVLSSQSNDNSNPSTPPSDISNLNDNANLPPSNSIPDPNNQGETQSSSSQTENNIQSSINTSVSSESNNIPPPPTALSSEIISNNDNNNNNTSQSSTETNQIPSSPPPVSSPVSSTEIENNNKTTAPESANENEQQSSPPPNQIQRETTEQNSQPQNKSTDYADKIKNEINDFKPSNEEKINTEDYKIVGEQDNYKRKHDEAQLSEIDKEFAKFDPTDLLSVVIYKFGKKDFYFNVTTAPCNIQIAFYALNEDGKLDMKVKYEDSTDILKQVRNSNEYITNFQATRNGLIHIQIKSRSKSEITVTLALHHDEHKNELFNLNHLTDMITRVNEVNKKAKKLESLKRQYSMKYRYHIDQAHKHNKNILIYSIVEIFMMIGIFVLQSRYIMKLTNRL